jgi:hypothetical protein
MRLSSVLFTQRTCCCCCYCSSSLFLQAVADLRAAGKSENEIEKFSVLFTEVRQQIDSKQLRPFIRTQYMRTAFQVRVRLAGLWCEVECRQQRPRQCAVPAHSLFACGRWSFSSDYAPRYCGSHAWGVLLLSWRAPTAAEALHP